jgi:hypothetical protein
MVDTYTKAILTVIALALVALALRPIVQPSPAVALGGACGSLGEPCYVATAGFYTVKVRTGP